MKTVRTLVRRSFRLAVILPLATVLYDPSAALATPVLDSARSFEVPGASMETETGSTRPWGDRRHPGTSHTGAEGFTQTETLAEEVQGDAHTEYNVLARQSVTRYPTERDFGEFTLPPGVPVVGGMDVRVGDRAMPVPEPASALLFATGLLTWVAVSMSVNRRRRHARQTV